MKSLILIFFFFLVTGLFIFKCRSSISATDMNPRLLKEKIYNYGCIDSYILLDLYYYGKTMDDDYLNISIMMYKKYDYHKAILNIFNAYIYKYNKKIKYGTGDRSKLFLNLPKDEQIVAISYLKEGIESGEYACFEALSDYYLSNGDVAQSTILLNRLKELQLKNIKIIKDSLEN